METEKRKANSGVRPNGRRFNGRRGGAGKDRSGSSRDERNDHRVAAASVARNIAEKEARKCEALEKRKEYNRGGGGSIHKEDSEVDSDEDRSSDSDEDSQGGVEVLTVKKTLRANDSPKSGGNDMVVEMGVSTSDCGVKEVCVSCMELFWYITSYSFSVLCVIDIRFGVSRGFQQNAIKHG
jgi:hypothetical protein